MLLLLPVKDGTGFEEVGLCVVQHAYQPFLLANILKHIYEVYSSI